MAIRTIRLEDDPILRKISKKVTKFDEKLELLVADMIETMHDAEGVGLAAPQIGVLKRVVVIDLYDDEGPFELINPEIIETHGEQCKFEGCLSVPGRSGKVIRPEYTKVRFQDVYGDFYEVEGEELLAIALCHEIDHLNGILYIDKQIEEAEEDV
ncbi:peptide deformylase [Fusibacter sp. 3D3]|uniref:peptide deformylase n=1 Tax=Fusibacter sp. 3D3 TaxID=1048380 RepID=UPI0008530A75|nr:peptide deformylase [Fusibacter sp. 3D3]GAU78742.1 peptide deformylase [Fusibacter sp. 3D3]